MKNKFNTIIFILFIIMTVTSSSAFHAKVGEMTLIQKDVITTYDVYDNDGYFTLETEFKKESKIDMKKDINIQIAEHILKYEGSDLINNSTEYSKYGVTKQALERYNKKYKTNYIVSKLTKQDALNIVVQLMKEYRVTEINDPRLRTIVFDTMYNTGNIRAGKITQRAINFYNGINGGPQITVDGIIGSTTIKNLNNIKDVDLFIKLFIYERLDSYKQFKEWDKYKSGWTKRIINVGNVSYEV